MKIFKSPQPPPTRNARDRALHDSMLSRLRRGADVRQSKIARVRAALREREYLNPFTLHIAADRLAEELEGENTRL